MSLRYGVELDETSLAILAVLAREQEDRFSEQNKKLDAAVSGISKGRQTLQADSESPGWQAFCLGLGQWGLVLMVALGCCMAVYFSYLDNDRVKAETQTRLEWYRTYYQLSTNGTARELRKFLKSTPPPEKP